MKITIVPILLVSACAASQAPPGKTALHKVTVQPEVVIESEPQGSIESNEREGR